MSEYFAGLATGLIAAAFLYFVVKGRQVIRAMDDFESDEPMTHDKLLVQVGELRPVIVLSAVQASELFDEHDRLDEHFAELSARETELHRELQQVKHVANTQALEAAHCRACCDELRAKLEAAEKRVKEEAYEAYWEASDSNRADRWAENFDESVRQQFEKYWQERLKVGA